jgi:hypothetical protein
MSTLDQPTLFTSEPSREAVETSTSANYAGAAAAFALDWAHNQHGSAAEFVRAMVREFGSVIRMDLIDIVEHLKCQGVDNTTKEYLVFTLSGSEIAAALGGRPDHRCETSALDQLFAQSRQLRTTSKYIEAVKFCAKLTNYSIYNNMLVYAQNPEVTFWATPSHWLKEFGRTVKGDARPMLILAPMTPVLFVYDVTDTEGPPLPEHFQQPFAVAGKLMEHRLDSTIENALRDGLCVGFKKMGLLHGGTAVKVPVATENNMWIELKLGESVETSYASLCHELAHIYLGHLGGGKQARCVSRLGLPKAVRELEAESVAWLVCSRSGLCTKSADYLAGYLTNPDEQQNRVSIDLVAKVAGRIEGMGVRVLPPPQIKDMHKQSQ